MSSLPCFKKTFPKKSNQQSQKTKKQEKRAKIAKEGFLPAVCSGLIPTPPVVITAQVAGFWLNFSATNLRQLEKGACSGTEILKNTKNQANEAKTNTETRSYPTSYPKQLSDQKTPQKESTYVLKGRFGSEARMILKVTLFIFFQKKQLKIYKKST